MRTNTLLELNFGRTHLKSRRPRASCKVLNLRKGRIGFSAKLGQKSGLFTFQAVKGSPIPCTKKEAMVHNFEIDNYWADDVEGLAESTFCPSDFKVTPLPRPKQITGVLARSYNLRSK
jgi:hypothetical protein